MSLPVRNVSASGLAAFTLLMAAGCGGPHAAAVTGVVSLDGAPLSTGLVVFHPVSGGPASYGGIHPDGNYRISTGTNRGLDPGEYDVTVSASAILPDANEGEPTTGETRSATHMLLTPVRYANRQTTDLRFRVDNGANKIDLRLTSR